MSQQKISHIAVFKFSGTYDENDLNSFGIVVHDMDSYPYPKVCTDDLLYRKMGYSNVDEYMESYPGKFTKNSEIKSLYIGKKNQKSFFMANIPVILDEVGSFKNVVDLLAAVPLPTVLESLFAAPTIDELSVIPNCNDNVKNKHLCFCLDWKEE